MITENEIEVCLGSARVSRAGDGVLVIANFFVPIGITRKVRCGETPQPARETRALPNRP